MSKTSDDNNSLFAQKLIEHMYKQDKLAQHFGIQIVESAQGYSKLSMRIREEMLNGHGICHGGVTFSLADTAFAYACNSRNQRTVALNCLISFSKVVREGDVLSAVAKEEILNKRTGVYDVTVSNQNGEVVALFRGASYSTKDELVPADSFQKHITE